MRMLLVLCSLISLSQISNAADHAAPSRMTGWEAFSELQNGNMRFYEGRAKHPNQDISKREELAGGQKPHTIVLSCSDSRVPPEEIFDQGLGDIFVVRVAGNVVNAENIASIEYAIEHLGAKFLLVMGHESCGAVGAAINSKQGVSSGSESLDVLVGKIRGNLSASAVAAGATDKTFRESVKENVAANLKELLNKSEIVKEAVGKKSLVLAQGIYSLKTGRVEFWDVGNKFFAAESTAAVPAPKIIEQKIDSAEIQPNSIKPPKKGKEKTKTKAAAKVSEKRGDETPVPEAAAAESHEAHH